MLRIATETDLETVKSLAYKFVMSSSYKDHYSSSAIDTLIQDILKGDKTKRIILLHGEDGMLVGMANRWIYGDINMATELAWWVNEDKRNTGVGKELIDAFEYWAKEIADCKGITMGDLDTPLGKYYTSRGYTATERAYVKWLL